MCLLPYMARFPRFSGRFLPFVARFLLVSQPLLVFKPRFRAIFGAFFLSFKAHRFIQFRWNLLNVSYKQYGKRGIKRLISQVEEELAREREEWGLRDAGPMLLRAQPMILRA